MNKNISVVIWFKNGTTSLFKDVEKFIFDGDKIVFDYFGESTQVKRSATFIRNAIAGYAVQE